MLLPLAILGVYFIVFSASATFKLKQLANTSPNESSKMMLRSSEVSLFLSAGIVVICGIAIFIAGYVIQQDTVEHLHASLRPHDPLSRNREHTTVDDPFDWSRLAHAQLVKTHDDMCDALIILHELHMSHSAAHRLLLFPRIWVQERSAADPIDEDLDRTIQWLKKASKLYRTILVPIGPLIEGNNGRFYIPRILNITNSNR